MYCGPTADHWLLVPSGSDAWRSLPSHQTLARPRVRQTGPCLPSGGRPAGAAAAGHLSRQEDPPRPPRRCHPRTRSRQHANHLGIGAASAIRCTASAGSWSPRPSSSPGGDGCGCGPVWRLGIRPVRSPRPGRARSCCARSTPPATWLTRGPRWIAFTAGAMASRSLSCPGWLAPCGPGRPRSWPGMSPAAAPMGPPRPVNLLIKKVKRVGHGFRNFVNYRLRLLLHCGVRWQTHRTVSLRGRPRPVALEPRGCP